MTNQFEQQRRQRMADILTAHLDAGPSGVSADNPMVVDLGKFLEEELRAAYVRGLRNRDRKPSAGLE